MLHSLLQFSSEEMTYEDLLIELANLSEEQLKQDVAIWNSDYEIDEFYQSGVEFVFATEECQVLDVDHPIIRF